MPHSRAMSSIGAGCYELRVLDDRKSWRIIYHVAEEAIVILHVFEKKSRKTPGRVIEICQRRLRAFHAVS